MANTSSRGKLLIAFALISVVAITAYAVFGFRKTDLAEDRLVKVVASIFPVYDFARAVGGDRIDLLMLLTPGIEAHSYEPKPSDVGRLSDTGLFIYTSKEMEPWAQDLAEGFKEGSNLSILEAGTVVSHKIEETDGHESGGAEGASSSAEAYDPHVWLDFTNAKQMVMSIAEALSGIDPQGADFYSSNAEAYCLRLDALDESYKETIAECDSSTIVHAGHYAFGYLAARYGLTYVAAQGFSPDSELGPRQVTELMSVLSATGSKYIFYEELIEPRAASAISEETGAGMLMLHAGHNISKEEFESGTTFIDLMERNLENLKTGLGYHGK